MTQDAKRPLGRILLRQRAVSQAELDQALESSKPGGPPLASRLIEAGVISEVAALKALSEQAGVPGIDLSQICIRLIDLALLPKEVALKHRILPVLVRDDRVFVAMASPTERKVLDEIEFVTGKHVHPYVALAGPLTRLIEEAYAMRVRGEAFYVGPRCTPEVMRRMGVTPPAEATPPAAPAKPQSSTRRTSPMGAPVEETATRGSAPPPLATRGRSVPPPAAPSIPPVLGGRRTPPARVPTPEAPPTTGDSALRAMPLAPRHPEEVAAQGSQAGAVVVDDALGRMAAADELTDTDFGTARRSEVSVLTQLPVLPPEPVKTHPGQKTVLIVDDAVEIRRLLRRVFEERGFCVLEADRGLLALAIVKEYAPDVLVLDAMLPEVHGFDIAKRLKGSSRYGHIPIVMVSAVYRGWRYAEDVKASYGVDAFLEKPFRASEVVRAVESALARSAPRGDDQQISAEAEKLLNAGIAAYRRGDAAEAIAFLREGTQIDPLAYRLHYHLGLLYGKQGQLYEAIEALQTALDINGKHFPALKNLAVLYQKAGFRNKAIEVWERALTVAPDEPTRQSIKEHLLGLL